MKDILPAMSAPEHTGMVDAYVADPPPARTSRAVKKNWTQIVQRFVADGVNHADAWQWAQDYAAKSMIRAPSRHTLRDWMLEAKRPQGLVRPYGKSKSNAIRSGATPLEIVIEPSKAAAPKIIERRQSPQFGHSGKPVLILAMNDKGGSRKSHTLALAFHAMIEAGLATPIVGTYGEDQVLKSLLSNIAVLDWNLGRDHDEKTWSQKFYPRSEDDFCRIDGPSDDEKWQEFRQLLLSTAVTDRPQPGNCGQPRNMLVDLPTHFRSSDVDFALGVLTDAHSVFQGKYRIVALVPTLPDSSTKLGAISSMRGIPIDSWIHVKYDADTDDDTSDEAAALDRLAPIAVVTPPELSTTDVLALRKIPPLSELAAYLDADPSEIDKYRPYLNYWSEVRDSLIAALKLACPEILTAEQPPSGAL